ncbi:hypothetical protein SAY86_005559 [Trapa natans]|uniref:SNARE-complex protein Syntaxin-18 N-terminal domain-containing protein n=1 Tax=Trapa natans TaxID=22666 RepID=A0AAN7L933_TRANT|nr:hypothetical protein SAY86_005559 [Trapa natans]
MAKYRDRTEDFKDVVRHTAVNLGYNESKLAAIMASFIIHKPRERSAFTKAALTTLESIGALEQFMRKHRKDYVDPLRTTEQERDNIEHEVTAFIKSCKEQIDILQRSISEEETNSKGWLGVKVDVSNADTIAHKQGVVLILSEKLRSVTAQFDQLRAIRFQDAMSKVVPRRKLNRETTSIPVNKNSITHNIELKEPEELKEEHLRLQQQHLDDETRALQIELTSLLDAVQETETKMVEMSALNHLMSTHVLQQAQQIEHLYEQAVEATNNVDLGNKELSKAIERNSSSRTFLLLFLFVMTFSILFLDWVAELEFSCISATHKFHGHLSARLSHVFAREDPHFCSIMKVVNISFTFDSLRIYWRRSGATRSTILLPKFIDVKGGKGTLMNVEEIDALLTCGRFLPPYTKEIWP